jgi:hypothetical protein
VSGGNHEAVQNRKGFLAQHLHEDSNGGSVQHGRFEQIQICDVFIDPIELAHVPDVFELKHHKWTRGFPFPWTRVSTERHSSQLSLRASQRGDSGRKVMAKKRPMVGIIWLPHGTRKAAVS